MKCCIFIDFLMFEQTLLLIRFLVLEKLEAEGEEPETPALPSTMMSKARRNRLHYIQLQVAL